MKILFLIVILGAVCALRHEEQAEPFVDFVKGFLEGINESGDINKILQCVKGGEDIIKKIVEALKLLQHLDIAHILDIIKGLQLLIEAVKDMIAIIKPCSESAEELKKLIEAIAHIDFRKLAMKIITHAAQFLHDIIDAIESFNKKNYHQAGKDIGAIMYRLFLEKTLEADPAYEFLRGFLEGINEKGDIKKLLDCIHGLDPIIAEIIEAIKLIMTFNPADVIKGVTMLIEAVDRFIKILEPCTEGFEQLEKLINAIMNADINKIVQKIISNPLHYIQEFYAIVSEFVKGDFFKSGKAFGGVILTLFLQDTASIDEFILFVEGFLEGIDAAHHFDDIKTCIEKIPEVWHQIVAAIEKIKQVDWRNLDKLVEALMELFEAFKKFLEGIKPCSKVPGEVEQIIKKITDASLEKILVKLQNNAFQIISDIMAAINHLKDKKFKDAGKSFGDILYILIFKE